MKRALLLIPMVLVVALSACGPDARGADDPAPAKSAGPTLWGTVTGTVHDPDGRPLGGALVVPRAMDAASPAPEKAVTTDRAGRYEWRLLPGRYELVAHADGRVSPAVAVSVSADRQTTADLKLVR